MRIKLSMMLCMLFMGSLPSQGQLKSVRYALNMKFGDVSKEQLINDIRFDDGIDDTVGVVRFDHIGPGVYPLIVSSKLPVATDSVGILSIKLQPDSLYKLLWTIHHINPKLKREQFDGILIRVTYRFKSLTYQYFETNFKITTGFCMIIEKRLISNGDQEALNKFYKFLAETGLFINDYGRRKWKYLH